MTEQVQEITQEQAATATRQLAELQAHPDFAAKFVSKTDGFDVKREYARLAKLSQHDTAKGGDRLDRIISGKTEIPFMETTRDGQISTANTIKSAEWLREAGLTDPQIKQALSGAQVSRAEYDAIKTMRSDRMGNKEFAARWLAGEAQAGREMLLMNTVIANGYVGQDAQPQTSTTVNLVGRP
jgi:hypothetical protein